MQCPYCGGDSSVTETRVTADSPQLGLPLTDEE